MHHIRRLAVDFLTEEFLYDELSDVYVVTEKPSSPGDRSGAKQLACGSLTRICQLPQLQQLIVLVYQDRDDHKDWTLEQITKHLCVRFHLYQQRHAFWVAPQVKICKAKVSGWLIGGHAFAHTKQDSDGKGGIENDILTVKRSIDQCKA